MRSLRSPSRMPSTRVDDSVTPYQSEPFFARTQTIAESAAPVIALNETLRQREMQFVQREVQSAASTADLAQQMPTVQQSAQIGRLQRDTQSLRETNAALKASIAAATQENADLASSVSKEALETENIKLRKEVAELESGKLQKAVAEKNRIMKELAQEEATLKEAEAAAAARDAALVALPNGREKLLPLMYGFPSYAYGAPPPPPSTYDVPFMPPVTPALELTRGVYDERIEKATSVKGKEYLQRLRNAERAEALMAQRESDAQMYDPFFRQTGAPGGFFAETRGNMDMFFKATNKDDADRRDLMKVKYPEYFVPDAYGDKPSWWWSGVPAKHRGTLAKQHFSDPRNWGTQVDRELFLQAELDKQLGEAYGTDPALSEQLLVQAVATPRAMLGRAQEGYTGLAGATQWMLQNPGMVQQQIAK